jgi:glycosyltransferase involved in cell wall biosynthesis
LSVGLAGAFSIIQSPTDSPNCADPGDAVSDHHGGPQVLVLTPVKNARAYLDAYFALLDRLTFPHERISLGLLESDSTDGTFAEIEQRLPELNLRFRRAQAWKRDFGFHLPADLPRWAPSLQIPRRTILAKSRNHLLMRALDDEDWVLWIDVDVTDYPADIVERLLAYGKDILHPHCVTEPDGPTFDLNAWREDGKVHMDKLRGGPDLARLDSVGGTMLMIRADLHRDGLIFPPFFYGRGSEAIRRRHPLLGKAAGELETEGLAIMARDMGVQCWGLPNLEILHRND